MNLRTAKKIQKNKETLCYNKGQVKKAENRVTKYERSK